MLQFYTILYNNFPIKIIIIVYLIKIKSFCVLSRKWLIQKHKHSFKKIKRKYTNHNKNNSGLMNINCDKLSTQI